MRERKITTEGYRTNRTGEQEFMQIVEWIRKLASSSRLFFFLPSLNLAFRIEMEIFVTWNTHAALQAFSSST